MGVAPPNGAGVASLRGGGGGDIILFLYDKIPDLLEKHFKYLQVKQQSLSQAITDRQERIRALAGPYPNFYGVSIGGKIRSAKRRPHRKSSATKRRPRRKSTANKHRRHRRRTSRK